MGSDYNGRAWNTIIKKEYKNSMKKSLRIGYNRYYDETIFEEHLAYIKENADVIDELTVFVEFSHRGYWPLDFCRKSAAILTDRIARYKNVGVKRVGINVMCTIGHLEEGWDIFPEADLPYMVNEYGERSKACLCASGEDFLKYVSEKFALFAATGADFVWYDDDVRTNNHGVAKHGCFCQNCIDKFNAKYATNFTRESLAAAVQEEDKTKRDWSDFQNEIKRRLVQTVCAAVRAVSPNVKVGAMTTLMEPFDEIESAKIDLCRPGGGFYNDDVPTTVMHKFLDVQKQILRYPSYITDIQYEYEAFNYQNLDKSMQMTDIETALAVMAGCNGVLYNNDIFNDRTDITELFRKRKNLWDALSDARGNAPLCGVYCPDTDTAKLISELGIPVTAAKEHASVALITGDKLYTMSDDEIKTLLQMPLFTDGNGVAVLCERGYEEHCGGTVKAVYESGMAERFSEHDLNGKFKNYYRDVFMNFLGEGVAYEFEPTEKAEVLANLETITHIRKGCAMYTVNGNFAADGYFMPRSLLSSAKQEQLYNTLDALSDFSLPIKIRKSLHIVPIVSKSDDGEMTVMLLNLSLDATGSFEAEIRNDETANPFYRLDKDGSRLPLRREQNGNRVIVSIDNIERMDYTVITNKR